MGTRYRHRGSAGLHTLYRYSRTNIECDITLRVVRFISDFVYFLHIFAEDTGKDQSAQL
jgi:hypothetical protein